MGFHIQGPENEDAPLAEINIIPLVDIMLVLLIIFMVAAPLSITGMKIQLPTSKAKGTQISEDRVVLTINRLGKFYIEKLEIPQNSLEEKMKSIFDLRERKEIYIRADRGVEYGLVIDAMSAAKLAGVSKMSMLTTPPKG